MSLYWPSRRQNIQSHGWILFNSSRPYCGWYLDPRWSHLTSYSSGYCIIYSLSDAESQTLSASICKILRNAYDDKSQHHTRHTPQTHTLHTHSKQWTNSFLFLAGKHVTMYYYSAIAVYTIMFSYSMTVKITHYTYKCFMSMIKLNLSKFHDCPLSLV